MREEEIMLDDSTSAETRRKLAEASDTPAEILEQLSTDSDRPCLLRHQTSLVKLILVLSLNCLSGTV